MLSFSSAEYAVNFVASFKSPGTRAAAVGGPLSSHPSGSFPAAPQRPLGPGESDAPPSHKTSQREATSILTPGESADLGAYPDAMAVCGERLFWDERKDVITNPALIVEVLSDSTEAYDRGDKFAHYRTIPSLWAYLLLSQHRVSAELYLRQPNGDWLLRTYDALQDHIPLTALETELALAEVYDKVELSPRE